ncbi:MAG TPA: hypothetical protein DDZ88_31370 [Verrucomicrobiales bacterium]|nr:hypothetical protein [Verrucomicrobiales bacterium]
MRILLTAILSLSLCILCTWFVMRPAFGAAEHEFYREVTALHAVVAARGVYDGGGNSIQKAQQLFALCKQMRNPVFTQRARDLAGVTNITNTPQGAVEFKALAESFFATYATQMQ